MPPYVRANLIVVFDERNVNLDPVYLLKGGRSGFREVRGRDRCIADDADGCIRAGRERRVEEDLEPVAGERVREKGLTDNSLVAGEATVSRNAPCALKESLTMRTGTVQYRPGWLHA